MLLLVLSLPSPAAVLTLLFGRGAQGPRRCVDAERVWVVMLRFYRFARKLPLLAAKGDELEEK